MEKREREEQMENTHRILIVDDQPRVRQSMRALLGSGMILKEVREAANGLEALRCLEMFDPDLVLMDIWMPEMDGIEATQIIKSRFPRVKVVLFSIYPGYQQTAMAVGADAFIAKEKPLELLSMAKSVLQGRGLCGSTC
jgi:CheY-like chemotaxis protein